MFKKTERNVQFNLTKKERIVNYNYLPAKMNLSLKISSLLIRDAALHNPEASARRAPRNERND